MYSTDAHMTDSSRRKYIVQHVAIESWKKQYDKQLNGTGARSTVMEVRDIREQLNIFKTEVVDLYVSTDRQNLRSRTAIAQV